MVAKQKAGGNKKYGKNAPWCLAYRMMGTREKNKKLKMERHLRHFPRDEQTKNAMRSIATKQLNALRNPE